MRANPWRDRVSFVFFLASCASLQKQKNTRTTRTTTPTTTTKPSSDPATTTPTTAPRAAPANGASAAAAAASAPVSAAAVGAAPPAGTASVVLRPAPAAVLSRAPELAEAAAASADDQALPFAFDPDTSRDGWHRDGSFRVAMSPRPHEIDEFGVVNNTYYNTFM